jgi:hypothetical protein
MITDKHLPIQMPVRPLDPATDLCPGLNQKLKGVAVDAPGFQFEMLLMSNQTVQPGQTISGYLTRWVIPAGFKYLPYNGSTFGEAEEINTPLPLKTTLCWDVEMTGELDHCNCSVVNYDSRPQGCIPILRSEGALTAFESDSALGVYRFMEVGIGDQYRAEIIQCKVFILAMLPNLSTLYVGFETREDAQHFITNKYTPAEPGSWIDIGAPMWMEAQECFVSAYEPGV